MENKNYVEAAFVNYTITKLNFELTPNFNFKGIVNIRPHFNSFYRLIDEDKFELILQISIANSDKEPSPFSLFGEIHGLFKCAGFPDKERNNFIKVNAMTMLFPYLRTAISNISTSCGVSPIILPIVDSRILTKDIIKLV